MLVSVFDLGNLQVSGLDLMSDNPARVSGRTIFTITNKIAAPSYWVLKFYADLKALNLRLEYVVK